MNVHHPTPTVVQIAINAALSSPVNLTGTDGATVVSLTTPAAWTAADISFAVSQDGVTYSPLYDARTPGAATEVTIPSASIPVNAARSFALDPSIFAGFNFVKVRSGTNASPVNQAAARSVTVNVRRV
jgi:hypothetical protein